MISVIIPAHNAAATLPAVFRSLFDAALDGLIGEVIVCDGGSTDETCAIADSAGAMVIEAGKGQEILAGAESSRKPWLLILNADAVLEKGWDEEVHAFLNAGDQRVAAFRIRAWHGGGAAAAGKAMRIKLRSLRTQRSCPAVLIPAKLFEAAGDIVHAAPLNASELQRRLGPGRFVRLKSAVFAIR